MFGKLNRYMKVRTRTDRQRSAHAFEVGVLNTVFYFICREHHLPYYILAVYGFLLGIRRILDPPNYNTSKWERDHHHEPAREHLAQKRRRGGIHAERPCPARRLDGIVKAGEAREGERIVRDAPIMQYTTAWYDA